MRRGESPPLLWTELILLLLVAVVRRDEFFSPFLAEASTQTFSNQAYSSSLVITVKSTDTRILVSNVNINGDSSIQDYNLVVEAETMSGGATWTTSSSNLEIIIENCVVKSGILIFSGPSPTAPNIRLSGATIRVTRNTAGWIDFVSVYSTGLTRTIEFERSLITIEDNTVSEIYLAYVEGSQTSSVTHRTTFSDNTRVVLSGNDNIVEGASLQGTWIFLAFASTGPLQFAFERNSSLEIADNFVTTMLALGVALNSLSTTVRFFENSSCVITRNTVLNSEYPLHMFQAQSQGVVNAIFTQGSSLLLERNSFNMAVFVVSLSASQSSVLFSQNSSWMLKDEDYGLAAFIGRAFSESTSKMTFETESALILHGITTDSVHSTGTRIGWAQGGNTEMSLSGASSLSVQNSDTSVLSFCGSISGGKSMLTLNGDSSLLFANNQLSTMWFGSSNVSSSSQLNLKSGSVSWMLDEDFTTEEYRYCYAEAGGTCQVTVPEPCKVHWEEAPSTVPFNPPRPQEHICPTETVTRSLQGMSSTAGSRSLTRSKERTSRSEGEGEFLKSATTHGVRKTLTPASLSHSLSASLSNGHDRDSSSTRDTDSGGRLSFWSSPYSSQLLDSSSSSIGDPTSRVGRNADPASNSASSVRNEGGFDWLIIVYISLGVLALLAVVLGGVLLRWWNLAKNRKKKENRSEDGGSLNHREGATLDVSGKLSKYAVSHSTDREAAVVDMPMDDGGADFDQSAQGRKSTNIESRLSAANEGDENDSIELSPVVTSKTGGSSCDKAPPLEDRKMMGKQDLGAEERNEISEGEEEIPTTAAKSSPPNLEPSLKKQTKSAGLTLADFQKSRLIETTSYCKVFNGYDACNGGMVVMKQIFSRALVSTGEDGKKKLARFENEIRLMQDLRHPNVVAYYGADSDEDNLYIFMEFLSNQGSSVKSLIDEHYSCKKKMKGGSTSSDAGGLPLKLIAKYFSEILEGLAYLHDHGVMHRDINTENLVIDSDGRLKLVDFGQAKNTATVTAGKGYQQWIAPEVVVQNKFAPASDIWASACAVVEMATTKPIFSWLPVEDQMMALEDNFHLKVALESAPSTSRLVTEPELARVIRRCLVYDFNDRPSAKALLQDPFFSREEEVTHPSTSSAQATIDTLGQSVSFKASEEIDDGTELKTGHWLGGGGGGVLEKEEKEVLGGSINSEISLY